MKAFFLLRSQRKFLQIVPISILSIIKETDSSRKKALKVWFHELRKGNLLFKELVPESPQGQPIKKRQTIKFKGKKKTRYFTYSNDSLKEIDLWFTHSALTQAIGRIRPLTSDKTINIYNDFRSEKLTQI